MRGAKVISFRLQTTCCVLAEQPHPAAVLIQTTNPPESWLECLLYAQNWLAALMDPVEVGGVSNRRVWWCMPIIPALGRKKQDDHKFEASLGWPQKNKNTECCALCPLPLSWKTDLIFRAGFPVCQ
jgi:hypothetical protein